MVIVITGTIGAGKTTVCRKLIEVVLGQGYTCSGILTYKSADKSIIIEDIQTGARETLACTSNSYRGPRTTKYFFNPEGIDFGIRIIDRDIASDLLLVDELGHLELRGEGFAQVLELIPTGEVKNCVLVIRSELLPRFLLKLPDNLLIFEATTSNRNKLPQEIGSILINKLC